MRVILASKSPRRREILEMLGVRFEIISADADEHSEERNPAALVTELSLRKGRAVRDLLAAEGEWNKDTLIIASDTVVAADGQILGKPTDENDAARMLRMLSGSTHEVLSGVALLCGDRELAAAERTGVVFSDMSENDIAWYVSSGEPADKAGAYAVQGLASLFIKELEGDYFNVVGLPVFRLNQLTKELLGRTLTEL